MMQIRPVPVNRQITVRSGYIFNLVLEGCLSKGSFFIVPMAMRHKTALPAQKISITTLLKKCTVLVYL